MLGSPSQEHLSTKFVVKALGCRATRHKLAIREAANAMRVTYKKLLSLFSLAMITALVVAACGGAEPTSTPGPTATPIVQIVTPTPTAVPKAGAAIQQTRFMSWVTNEPDFSLPAQYGGTATISSSYNPAHFDPTLITDSSIYTAVGPVYSRMMRCKFAAEREVADFFACDLTGDLIESWTIGADGQSLTMKVRQGVNWQNLPPVNGRALTADDIVYSVNEYRNSPVFERDWAIIEDVSSPDPQTVVLTLGSPFYDIVAGLLAYTGVRVVPREIKEQDGDFKSTAVGTGAFILKEFTPKERIVWERNPDYYFEGRPYLDRVESIVSRDRALQQAAYRAGQILFSFSATQPANNAELAALLRSRPDSVSVESPADSGVFQIALDIETPPFDNHDVRKAFASAIDWQRIIDTIFEGRGDLLPNIPWIFWSDDIPTIDDMGPHFQYNPDRARQLLASSGVDLPLELSVNTYLFGPAQGLIMQAMKEMFREVDIDFQINQVPYGQYQEALNTGTYEQSTMTYVRTHSGIDGYAYQTLRSTAVRNSWRIKHPTIDRIVDELRGTADPAQRQALVKELVDFDNDFLFRIPIPLGRSLSMWDPKFHNFDNNRREIWPYTGSQTWEVMWLSQDA